jgi:hypothetical protein
MLPSAIIDRIFGFVSPLANDESYETCEESALDDSCPLCELRDLSHCGQVSKRWRSIAIRLM